MSVTAYPNKRWRADKDGAHRLIGSGLGYGLAILATVIQSKKPERHGQFWWSVTPRISGYAPTFEEAKGEAEKAATALEER